MTDKRQCVTSRRFGSRPHRPLNQRDGSQCRLIPSRPHSASLSLEAASLLPVLSRAVDVGRGPASLLSWLQGRLDRPDSDGTAPNLDRLATEVAELLRRQPATASLSVDRHRRAAGATETVVVSGSVSDADEPTIVNAQERAAVAPSSAVARETILLTEDDDAVRKLMQHILEHRGYSVLAAPNGMEAIRLAEWRKGAIDLLITDLVMPTIGGVQLANHLAAYRPEIKVLFVSGHTEEFAAAKGVVRSQSLFLQKPFGPVQLAQTVRDILDS